MKKDEVIDSLAGAKTWLEDNPNLKIALVNPVWLIYVLRAFERIGEEIEDIETKGVRELQKSL